MNTYQKYLYCNQMFQSLNSTYSDGPFHIPLISLMESKEYKFIFSQVSTKTVSAIVYNSDTVIGYELSQPLSS